MCCVCVSSTSAGQSYFIPGGNHVRAVTRQTQPCAAQALRTHTTGGLRPRGARVRGVHPDRRATVVLALLHHLVSPPSPATLWGTLKVGPVSSEALKLLEASRTYVRTRGNTKTQINHVLCCCLEMHPENRSENAPLGTPVVPLV